MGMPMVEVSLPMVGWRVLAVGDLSGGNSYGFVGNLAST